MSTYSHERGLPGQRQGRGRTMRISKELFDLLITAKEYS